MYLKYLLVPLLFPIWWDQKTIYLECLFLLGFRIISCLQYCVTGYFYIFLVIFNHCLDLIENLIGKYLDYLAYLTFRLTLFPTNLIFVLGGIFMLYQVRLIIKDILGFHLPQHLK